MKWLWGLALVLGLVALAVCVYPRPRGTAEAPVPAPAPGPPTPSESLHWATQAMDRKDYPAAVRHLDAAIDGLADGRDKGLALATRGRARFLAGDPAGAVPDYDAALRNFPAAHDIYRNRGEAHLALGAFDQAAADLTEAIRLAPFVPESYTLRAKAYRGLGREADAAADDRQAKVAEDRLRIKPDRGGAAGPGR